jgi:hypothetical protein
MSGLMKIDPGAAAPVVTVTSVSTVMPVAPPPVPPMAAPVQPYAAPPAAVAAEPPAVVLPVRETPIPAGERIDLEPRARRKPAYWVIAGGVGVLAAAGLLILVATKSSSGSPPPAEPAKEPVVVAQAEPPQPTTPEPAVADTKPVPAPAEVDESAGPVLGEGPCKVTIASTPAGSMISLDGKVLAPSPLTVATTCEAHQVELAHPRYKTATKQIVLTADKPGSIDVSLDRPTHAVSVTSTPPGATIFIDGRRAGTTPTVVSVMGFQSLKLEIKKTGYQPQSTKLYSKVAQDKIAVRLNKW